MKIITTMLQDELYESTNDKGVSTLVDMRSTDVKAQLSPVEHLLSSLAACGAVDIVAILRKRRKTIQSFTIETSGIRNEEPPRYFKSIHCIYKIKSNDIILEEFEKAAALSLEKYCSVAASLKSTITFEVKLDMPDVDVS